MCLFVKNDLVIYQKRKKGYVLLSDGTIFFGKSVGIEGTSFGEICFNTGMTGYQEIFTDPSYFGQIMVTTNSHIGNYGTVGLDDQSSSPKISGLVCKNFSFNYSRPIASESLENYFSKINMVVISDVDTRALVNYIRENGAMNAAISTQDKNIELIKNELSKFPSMDGLELASKVSTKKSYYYGKLNSKYKVAVLDLGVKKSILENISKRGAYLKIFPYNTSFEEMDKWSPDAYFISNGPGDPKPLINAQITAKKIISKNIPLFGICLGHQIIALANSIKTYKMFNGHRGINHPVLNLLTKKGEITSQNHGFAVNVDEAEKNSNIEITHTHLNDGTVAGLRIKNKKCFSVQYHPEASPGPNDSNYLFDNFFELINEHKNKIK